MYSEQERKLKTFDIKFKVPGHDVLAMVEVDEADDTRLYVKCTCEDVVTGDSFVMIRRPVAGLVTDVGLLVLQEILFELRSRQLNV